MLYAWNGTPLCRRAKERTCTFLCACDECKQGDKANARGAHAKCVQERRKLSTGRVLAVSPMSLANWLAGDVSSDSASCISTVPYCQKFHITSRKQALLQTRTVVSGTSHCEVFSIDIHAYPTGWTYTYLQLMWLEDTPLLHPLISCKKREYLV